MTKPTRKCTIDGCERKHYGRGWCERHYKRWRTHGSPTAGGPYRKFASKQTPPADGLCTIEGCQRPHHGLGLCSMHHQRLRKHGNPLGGKSRYATPEEAFAARTEWQGECLIWTGSKKVDGYGMLRARDRSVTAHRYAWESAHGPIPAGMVVDHKYHCDPACCNVDHLRLATATQNSRNRAGADVRSKSGIRNVHRRGNQWTVRVKKNGKSRYFGTFATIEEASAAAEHARKELFGAYSGKG